MILLLAAKESEDMKLPKTTYWSWKRTIPQLFAMVFTIGIMYLAIPSSLKQNSVLYGAIVYLGYSIGSRQLIPRHHRKGVSFLNSGKYEKALKSFKKSKQFFETHSWIDRYRPVVLMSPSIFSYHEMAMINIAEAYIQLNDISNAMKAYNEAIAQYPNNIIATTVLKIINSNSGVHSS